MKNRTTRRSSRHSKIKKSRKILRMRGGMRRLSPRLAAKKVIILAAKAAKGASLTSLRITVADFKNAVERINAAARGAGRAGPAWPPPPQSLSFARAMVDSIVSMPPTAEFAGFKKSMIPGNIFTDLQNFIRTVDTDTNNGRLQTSTASFTLTQNDAQKIFDNGIHYKYLLTFLIDNFEGVAAIMPPDNPNQVFVVLLRLILAKLTPLVRNIKYNKSLESSFTIQVADLIEILELSTGARNAPIGARNMIAEYLRQINTEYIIPLNNSAPKTSNGVNIQKIFDDISGFLQALNAWARSLEPSSVTSFTISLSDGKEFYRAIKPFLPPITRVMMPITDMFGITPAQSESITPAPSEKLNIITLGVAYVISVGSTFINRSMIPQRFAPILYNLEAFAHNMVELS